MIIFGDAIVNNKLHLAMFQYINYDNKFVGHKQSNYDNKMPVPKMCFDYSI